jgi:hypothetical protein
MRHSLREKPMKNTFAALFAAIAFVACAPNNPVSSYALDFAPSSPLGARITGNGNLVVSSSGSSRLQLELRGLPASSVLGVAVLIGSCTNQGHVIVALPDVSSDVGGNAKLDSSFKNGVVPSQAYVNVFQKSAANGYGTALACANLQ